MPVPRPRVLAIAEAANPEWVSVPLVGWSLASALRAHADVHIVTQIRNRDAFLRAGLVEDRDFTAIDSEAVAAPMYRAAELLRMGEGRGWTTMTAIAGLSYPYFERLVWRRFGAAIRGGAYDIVHRITPLSPTTPSPLAGKVARAGVAFVLGPLNGGVPWPRGFETERRREREWLSYVRSAYRLNPQVRWMQKAASLIIAGSRHTALEIPAALRDKVVWLPENAIDPTRFCRVAPQDLNLPLRACFVGRLVPYKGTHMLLEAMAPFLRDGRMVLDIVGEGPMQGALQARVAALEVGGGVTFHGQLPHERVQDILGRANLLTFPSIREFGGGVVLEAMALGVVPMVVDYAGPGELVTPETGMLIPVGPRAQIIADLRGALAEVLADPGILTVKAAAARALVRSDYTWDAKARRIAQMYRDLVRAA